jgi:hypothetical protein
MPIMIFLVLGSMVAAEHIPMHFPAVFCPFPDDDDLSVV